MKRCPYCKHAHERKRSPYCSDDCRRAARNERRCEARAAKPVTPRRCPYCMAEHAEKGRRYCCPEHARRGAGHNSAAGGQRARALKQTRQKAVERSKVSAAFRKLAMGDDSQLWTVIYNPVLRKRRKKLGLLSEPK